MFLRVSGVDIIDLDSDKFNPVMSGQDLLAFRNHEASDPQAIDYINDLGACNYSASHRLVEGETHTVFGVCFF